MIRESTGAVAVRTPVFQSGRVVESASDGAVIIESESGERFKNVAILHATTEDAALAVGDRVLVLEQEGEVDQVIVLGRIGPSHAELQAASEDEEVMPDELVIQAKSNLTLKCGEGSITIREDGKILIKGKDLVSHAQRMNRIKGGSVSIN